MLQAVKRSPVNLRPLLRIRPAHNHKAIGLVASAYSYLGATGDEAARASASNWLDWLEQHHAGDAQGLAWAYHFDVQTRFFFYPANSPNTIATTFVALAFLDAVEQSGDERRLEAAVSASEFLVSRMLVDDPRRPYFGYVPGDTKLIHNCNLLACATLMRAARFSGRADLADIAARAVLSSLAAQRQDGSWPYSEWSGQGWVDNFHTGYVLESLASCTEIDGVEDALTAGSASGHASCSSRMGGRSTHLDGLASRRSLLRAGDRYMAGSVRCWKAGTRGGLPARRPARARHDPR